MKTNLVVLLATLSSTLASPARADIVAGVLLDSTHLGGIQAGGADAYVEATTRIAPRLELFADGGLGYLAVGVLDTAQSGVQGRAAVGARLRPMTWGSAEGGIDLYIDVGAGGNAYWWAGHHLARPDLDLGWGFQVRTSHRILLRSGIQALISSDTTEPTFICRGCMMSRPQSIDGGLVAVFGVSL